MKFFLPLLLFLFTVTLSASAQSVYDLSFNYQHNTEQIAYKAFFIDYNDGNCNIRLRFKSPAGNVSILVDIDATEEIAALNPACAGIERIYYKLKVPKFIESNDPGIKFPAYFCLKKDTVSGLYEPMGVTNSSAGCNTDVVKFSKVVVLDQKELTKEFVLTYFKPYDFFYRNLFVTNNSKDLTTSERNVKLYLLFVANVTDELIGAANSKDMYDAIKFFGKVKDFLGIDAFVYDSVTRNDFNKKTVLNKINSFLTPGPKDIVVFYYAGHGFRQPRDGRPGPYIDLRDLVKDKKKKYLENSLSMEDIRDIIRKKGARLNLVLSDCCNDNVTSTNPMAEEPAISGKKGLFHIFWNTQKCRDLFLNATPATILATAASPYQLAVSNAVFGGYFSNFLINTLETNLSLANKNPKLTWDDAFEQVKKQTQTKSGRTWCNEAKTVKCNRQLPFVTSMYGRF
jgi:hypothetical protein